MSTGDGITRRFIGGVWWTTVEWEGFTISAKECPMWAGAPEKAIQKRCINCTCHNKENESDEIKECGAFSFSKP